MSAVANEHVQRELLREAAESGPAAIFVLGDDRRPVAVNDSACRLLGYTRSELLGLDATALSADGCFADLPAVDLARENTLTAKDGRAVRVVCRTSQARVAGIDLWVCVALPLADA